MYVHATHYQRLYNKMKTLKPFGVLEKPSHLSRTSLLNSRSIESDSNFTKSMRSR